MAGNKIKLFEMVVEFMKKYPGEPYIHMVHKLGDDVAPIQLESAQFDEAENHNILRFAAMDSLVRDMRRFLNKGWEGGAVGHFATVQAKVAWLRRLDGSSRNREPNSEMQKIGESVWFELEQIKPPVGWLPNGPCDTHITSAFATGWPVSMQAKASFSFLFS